MILLLVVVLVSCGYHWTIGLLYVLEQNWYHIQLLVMQEKRGILRSNTTCSFISDVDSKFDVFLSFDV